MRETVARAGEMTKRITSAMS